MTDNQRLLELEEEKRVLLERLASQEDMFKQATNYMENLQRELELSKATIEQQNQELEQKIQERTEELTVSNTELNTLLYRASHDLKAPLCTTMGLLNLARTSADKEEMLGYMDMIKDPLKRLDKILGELAFVGGLKDEQAQIAKVDIDYVVKKAINECCKQFPEGTARFELDIHLNEEVYTDKYLLGIVIKNIVSNSLTFYKDGRTPIVKISAVVLAEKFQLTIEDNGEGIRPEMQAKIFNMFYRGSVKSAGSGLGLYAVQKALKQLNGNIIVESKLNVGTKMTVLLPMEKQ